MKDKRRMKINEMTIDALQREKDCIEEYIINLKRSLKFIPNGSILAELSILANINYANKKLNKVNNELEQRSKICD